MLSKNGNESPDNQLLASIYLSQYNESATFIQTLGKVANLTIKDSELMINSNKEFFPKNYARYLKIKNSKFTNTS